MTVTQTWCMRQRFPGAEKASWKSFLQSCATWGKVDLGPMPKNDMHSLTTKQAREGDSGNNRIPEETKEKVNSSRGRRERRATRDYKTHYDSNYAA